MSSPIQIPDEAPKKQLRALADGLGLSQSLAELLWQRGHRNVSEARKWLYPSFDALEDPFQFRDMERAVRRIKQAIHDRESILIHGDYDVDGLTATVLLLSFLRMIGACTDYYIPNRKDGYSFQEASVKKIREGKFGLCISVDHGTGAIKAIDRIQEGGCDVIVTDHHGLGPEIANAYAVLNPKLADETYPYRDLAGVGVAFKLAWGIAASFSRKRMLSAEFKDFLIDAACLVALGTVADVMPLNGENRVLVRNGIAALPLTKNPGIRALIDCLGPDSYRLCAEDISFRIGPRLNAAGRMGNADAAIQLLTAPSYGEARNLARQLEVMNKQRQGIEAIVLEEALVMVRADVKNKERRVLCVWKDAWHVGVLGIVAARLVQEFDRPAIVMTIVDGTTRGSGRSCIGINLKSLLDSISDLPFEYGGHARAIGLNMATDKLTVFRQRLDAAATRLPKTVREAIRIDSIVSLSHWCSEELKRLALFRPYGEGNPPPKFLATNVRMGTGIRRVGPAARGLVFTAIQDGVSLRAIPPGLGRRIEEFLRRRAPWNLVYTPHFSTRPERGAIEIQVHAIFAAELAKPAALRNGRI